MTNPQIPADWSADDLRLQKEAHESTAQQARHEANLLAIKAGRHERWAKRYREAIAVLDEQTT